MNVIILHIYRFDYTPKMAFFHSLKNENNMECDNRVNNNFTTNVQFLPPYVGIFSKNSVKLISIKVL